jgi:hypothetical protein
MAFSSGTDPAPREELDIEVERIGKGVRIIWSHLAQIGVALANFPVSFKKG